MSGTSSPMAQLVARINGADEDTVQEARRTAGVGASEIAAVLGLSKWQSELGLYAAKRGEVERWRGNEATNWGKRLEHVIVGHRAEIAARHGRSVVQPWRIYRSLRNPDMTCSPDALEYPLTATVDLDAPPPPVCLDDAKTADAYDERAWRQRIPVQYVLQVQYGAHVLGAPTVALDVLFGGNRPQRFEFETDPELGEMLSAAATQFMDRVREGRPPAAQHDHPGTAELLAQMHRGVPGEKKALPAELVRELMDLRALQEQQSWVKAEIDASRNRIREFLGDGTEGYVTVDGKPLTLVTWSAAKDSIDIDMKALREQHPHLYRMVETRVGRPAARSTRMSIRAKALDKIPNPKEK